MSENPTTEGGGALKNKTWIFLVAAFAILIAVGIITT